LESFVHWLVDVELAPFYLGFCVSLVRPLVLIGFGLILFYKLGLGLGIPLLFWRPRALEPGQTAEYTRPNRSAQFLVGLGLGALLWQVILSGYLYEEFEGYDVIDRPPFCEAHWNSTHLVLDDPFPGRFRFAPQEFGSMWRYGATVAWGFFTLFLLFGALIVIYYFGSRFWWWVRGWRPWPGRRNPSPQQPEADIRVAILRFIGIWGLVRSVRASGIRGVRNWVRGEPPPLPANRVHWLDRVGRVPWSPFLPLGVICGAFLLSVFTSYVWLQAWPTGTQKAGYLLMRLGTVGGTDLRKDAMQCAVDGELARTDPDQWIATIKRGAYPTLQDLDKKGGQREWLSPYVPLYGAFTFNFLLICAVSILLIIGQKVGIVLFSPAVGIVLLCGILVWSNLVMKSFFPFPGEYWLLFLFVVMLVMGRAYKLRFPYLTDYYDDPVDLNARYIARAQRETAETNAHSAAAAARPGLPPPPPLGPPVPSVPPRRLTKLVPPVIPIAQIPSAGVNRYVPTGPGCPNRPPLAIVCVSGGGSRAAAWTMKTLLEIEHAFSNPVGFGAIKAVKLQHPVAFPYHMRLLTGASGGMVAGAYYVASLAAPGAAPVGVVNRNPAYQTRPEGSAHTTPLAVATGPSQLQHTHLYEGVCRDYLTPVVHTLVARDFPSWFLPFHFGRNDRGYSMEREWQTAMHGQLDQTFGELRPGELAGWRPSLIFSPMMVEDARQLFISNLDLAEVVRNLALILGEPFDPNSNQYNPQDPDGRRLLSREGIEFFKLFEYAHDFRVGTAARMSASFPYVMPAVPIPTNPPRRVVDAGYYDNYGVGIAASWLFNNLQWVRHNTSGVVIIQIRDGASGEDRRREAVLGSFPSIPSAGLQGFSSPPGGLYNSRFAGNAFRNDNVLHLLDRYYRTYEFPDGYKFPDGFLATVTFELPGGDDVALNWCLTEGERNTIESAVALSGFHDQVAGLLDWWHQRTNSALAATPLGVAPVAPPAVVPVIPPPVVTADVPLEDGLGI
jgi:hypothetical protein